MARKNSSSLLGKIAAGLSVFALTSIVSFSTLRHKPENAGLYGNIPTISYNHAYAQNLLDGTAALADFFSGVEDGNREHNMKHGLGVISKYASEISNRNADYNRDVDAATAGKGNDVNVNVGNYGVGGNGGSSARGSSKNAGAVFFDFYPDRNLNMQPDNDEYVADSIKFGEGVFIYVWVNDYGRRKDAFMGLFNMKGEMIKLVAVKTRQQNEGYDTYLGPGEFKNPGIYTLVTFDSKCNPLGLRRLPVVSN